MNTTPAEEPRITITLQLHGKHVAMLEQVTARHNERQERYNRLYPDLFPFDPDPLEPERMARVLLVNLLEELTEVPL
ncbi:hypothetical protein [Candidatus Chloroploca asiatica]|uniref:Uncharacterized protein n=1 Tax=Candidatus Chloroploca asiatica TaxID=1506545 RepID=A0A2H3KR45_9CHLR|nr:hypothetical protein [Candidatus Chloroploca asiatica]PDW00974.1 hypothetical protein A9Q02_21330 [Candidatus Chloroploca asiatica]